MNALCVILDKSAPLVFSAKPVSKNFSAKCRRLSLPHHCFITLCCSTTASCASTLAGAAFNTMPVTSSTASILCNKLPFRFFTDSPPSHNFSHIVTDKYPKSHHSHILCKYQNRIIPFSSCLLRVMYKLPFFSVISEMYSSQSLLSTNFVVCPSLSQKAFTFTAPFLRLPILPLPCGMLPMLWAIRSKKRHG